MTPKITLAKPITKKKNLKKYIYEKKKNTYIRIKNKKKINLIVVEK